MFQIYSKFSNWYQVPNIGWVSEFLKNQFLKLVLVLGTNLSSCFNQHFTFMIHEAPKVPPLVALPMAKYTKKLVNILSIYKKGSHLLISNYRPISLLSNLNKIFEKIIFKRVYNFIEKNEILYPLQYGFHSKHSTTHALINITEKIRSALIITRSCVASSLTCKKHSIL